MRTFAAIAASLAVHVVALGALAYQRATPRDVEVTAPSKSTTEQELLFVDVASVGPSEDEGAPTWKPHPLPARESPRRPALVSSGHEHERVSGRPTLSREAPAPSSPDQNSGHEKPDGPSVAVRGAATTSGGAVPGIGASAATGRDRPTEDATAASTGDEVATSGRSPPGAGPVGAEGGRLAAIDLAALHARLAAAARGCYPPAAVRFRLTGTVPVHFCVDSSGALSSIELRGTSGSALLDRAARDCVLPRAAPLRVPASCFDVPVAFR